MRSAPLVSPRAFPVEALADALGAAVYAHPIDDALTSPFESERELAESLGPLRGPHLLGGRLAAHAALASIGIEPEGLLREATGAVRWPPGLVGAIAHTHGLALAIVGQRDQFHGVGIDIEARGRTLDEGTRRIISRPEEHGWLDEPPPLPGAPLLMLAAAKEVVFKAYFPPTQVRLRFEDAIVEPSPQGFHARVLRQELEVPREMDILVAPVGSYLVLAGGLSRRSTPGSGRRPSL